MRDDLKPECPCQLAPDDPGCIYAEGACPVHTGAPKKRAYQPPKLTFLGTTADMTRGVGGASPDGAGGQSKVTGA